MSHDADRFADHLRIGVRQGDVVSQVGGKERLPRLNVPDHLVGRETRINLGGGAAPPWKAAG
ncbi:MAG: hypothetical protein KDM64_04440 [Verrucomicrobiae bacterium]|nr:hypothetical protein [Verrucomicrobiae bacterium]